MSYIEYFKPKPQPRKRTDVENVALAFCQSQIPTYRTDDYGTLEPISLPQAISNAMDFLNDQTSRFWKHNQPKNLERLNDFVGKNEEVRHLLLPFLQAVEEYPNKPTQHNLKQIIDSGDKAIEKIIKIENHRLSLIAGQIATLRSGNPAPDTELGDMGHAVLQRNAQEKIIEAWEEIKKSFDELKSMATSQTPKRV